MDQISERIQRMKALQAAKSDGSTCPNGLRKSQPIYQCTKCQDQEGYIARDKNGYEVWCWCECHVQRRVERLFKYSRITNEFRRLSFESFILDGRPQPVKNAFACAKAYLEYFSRLRSGRNNSIALLGKSGSGKTHLLIAVANSLLSQGVGVLYFPWIEGMNDLKSNFEVISDKVQQLKQVEVLFIDDLFKGRKTVTDFQLEQLFDMINYRYLNHLPIMVSSEKDIDQLCTIDEAIGSRIYEMCKDFTVILKGDKSLNYRIAGKL
ncbi:ATP-binding protein [Thermoflavimicrobium daqui]|uniref:AAA+ ATPase domain-containing protein n=1 Tax=Thermoflavimicrobium daqui TaxID=2137476 RepID=A0A364K8W9_9BACL|nr:ATP-binding protein [Thermoflavimicrobium daqui]RAL26728.1 hypothetical protein DL897_01365 [Thermoflavimicrobium daqui]